MADILQKRLATQTLQNADGAAITNDTSQQATTADLDNTTAGATSVDFELNAGFGATVTVNEDIHLYLVPSLDGTNFADQNSGSNAYQADHFVGTFLTPSAGTAARRLTVQGVSIGTGKYRAYLHNTSGQQVSANWTLRAFLNGYQN